MIIFLTGDIASETTWEFIEQNRLPYILKPVSAPELHRKLREVMGERLKAAPKKGAEQRRHRRLAMKANLRVRKKRWAAAGPEITLVGNASKEGVMGERLKAAEQRRHRRLAPTSGSARRDGPPRVLRLP